MCGDHELATDDVTQPDHPVALQMSDGYWIPQNEVYNRPNYDPILQTRWVKVRDVKKGLSGVSRPEVETVLWIWTKYMAIGQGPGTIDTIANPIGQIGMVLVITSVVPATWPLAQYMGCAWMTRNQMLDGGQR